jgi:chemotaxis protein MotB
MTRTAYETWIGGAALLVALSGCANGSKERLSRLEGANKDLSGRLNQTQSEMDALRRDRDDLNRRLTAAMREAEQLRAQLANQPVPVEPPAPGWTAVPGGAMIAIDDSVLFNSGKATLRDEARKTLDAVASTIQGQYAEKDILVFGHTDDRPIKKSGWDDNWQLSTERALAVVRYMKERSIAAERLVAAGCGEFRPRVPNSSEANRFSNRRVEIFAIDPQPRTGRK